ncbi:hypothetical protein Hanom_Chr02g00113431 [Helianthus anomalus]
MYIFSGLDVNALIIHKTHILFLISFLSVSLSLHPSSTFTINLSLSSPATFNTINHHHHVPLLSSDRNTTTISQSSALNHHHHRPP